MKQLAHITKRRSARTNRRGNLLMVSITFVLVVASMGMVMLQMHTAQSRRQLQATDNKRALYIAEAGLAESFVCIAQGRSGNVGSEAIPALYADGVYWVEATPGTNDEIGLISTGLCGTGRFALSIVLQRQTDPIASLGFYSKDDVTIGQGSIIDGYNSSKGTFAEQLDPSLEGETTGSNAMINAGGDLTLDGDLAAVDPDATPMSGTRLYGEAHPGPNGVVSQAADVTVTGSTTPMRTIVNLPAVTPPESDAVSVWKFGTGSGVLTTGEHHYASAEVSSRNTLRIEGPAVVVFDELRINRYGTLQIDSTNGQVVIFVQEYLELAEGSFVDNVTVDPTGLALFASGTEWIDRDGDRLPDAPVNFSPSGEFYGFLYAPSADLTLLADLHLLGGVASNSLTIADGGHLTFDMALIGSEITAAGMPKLVAWRIVELPDSDLVRTRTDPIRELETAGITPIKSSEASEDKWVRMKYYEADGTVHAYAGMSSGLDWSTVYKVIGIMWDDDSVIGDEGQVWVAPSTMTESRVEDSSDDAVRVAE